MQVVPATQVPDPVHPVPPHCAYFAKVPPPLLGLVVEAPPEVVVAVGLVDDGAVVVPPDPPAPEDVPTTAVPVNLISLELAPTYIVNVPLGRIHSLLEASQ